MTNPETAIVAGVGSGLGKTLCRQLTSAGYRVAGFARTTAASQDLSDDLSPDRFLAVLCNVTDAA